MSSVHPAPPRRDLASAVVAAVLAVSACVVLTPVAPAGASTPAGDRCFVRASFQVFLDREASSFEVSTWTDRFAYGLHRSRLPDDLANSGEWLAAEVDKLYRAALDRAPDAAGRAYWIDQLRRGARVNRVGSLVYGSPEFYANAGGTPAGFVDDLYARILDRTASPADRDYWVGQVGRIGRGEVAAHFFGSVESRTSRVRALYQQILDRAPDPSGLSYWVGRLARVNDVRLAVLLASAPEFYNRHEDCGPSQPPPYLDSSNGTGSGGLPRGWFEGGEVWYGDFGDPHVINVGGTYHAYGSPTGGRVLPVLTSTDTRRWEIHRRWSSSGPPGTPGYSVQNDPSIPAEIRSWWPSGSTTAEQREWLRYDNNDALVRAPSWGLDDPSNWLRRTIWAPGVAQIGGSWYAYYAVKTNASVPGFPYGRFCLSVAKASSPLGPFRDISGSQPLWCDPSSTHPGGSIDPFPYVDPANGQAYLLWKASGKPGVRPSALMSMRLGSNGLPLAGQSPVTLLTTWEGGWEGYTIENPSMIRYGGRYYLFYSGNSSDPSDSDGYSNYASGYATCTDGPRSSCTRRTVDAPLIGNTPDEWGTGGATPLVTNDGQLNVAYAFFWPGERRGEYPVGAGRHPRRMNMARMEVASDGTLTAVRRTWLPGG